MRNAIEAGVADAAGVRFAPSNDPEGDCGVVAAFQFEDEATARGFVTAPGVDGYLGIDHGKHVYTAWEPLRAKRIMHHPGMNPFNFARNSGMRCTVFCPLNPDWTETEISARVTAITKAARG